MRERLPSKMSDYEDMETELAKPINYQLRKEILLFTSRGICDVVDEVLLYTEFLRLLLVVVVLVLYAV